jgi:hypothetical protein
MAKPPRDDLDGAVRVARAYAQLAMLAVGGGADPRDVYHALNRALDDDLASEEKLLVRTAVFEAALGAFASGPAPVVEPDASPELVPHA